MNNAAIYDELDQVVEKILSGEEIAGRHLDPLVRELLPVADDLRKMPRAEFRAALWEELEEQRMAVLPSLLGLHGGYPVQRRTFAISAALHAAAIALLCMSTLWVATHPAAMKQVTTIATDLAPYVLPSASKIAGGGGGGGDRDKLAASRGEAPRFAREQIVPPAIVLRNNNPKLAVEATVVGPPDVTLPKMNSVGDPLSGVLTASNGSGAGGGIGTGDGGGVGSGDGTGVGAGYGGGFGGGFYRIGNGVSAPRALYTPEPQYTDEARKAHYQGVVLLSLIVGPDGRVHDSRVARSLGMGLDEKAMEAVRLWKFAPAMKDGQPVAVQVHVEVSFRLY
ncbi:MAG TPA: energy transducer TonB [Candidatus Koribacter sp.]|jgi:TonB family protein